MTDPGGHQDTPGGDPGQPSVSPDVELGVEGELEPLASAEAFQTLASEVRITVLVTLLSAERSGDEPLSFSELQRTAGADTSAGFAYHLRQLSGHFVTQGEDGYVLTAAGRRAAEAVVSGTFTDAGQRNQAS